MSGVRPHDDLGIAAWEHAALLVVRAWLAAGAIAIDMGYVDGGVGGRCLGAHVHAAEIIIALAEGRPSHSRRSAFRYVLLTRSPALADLYAPGRDNLGHPGWKADARQALAALDAFLAGSGRRCWDEACTPTEAVP